MSILQGTRFEITRKDGYFPSLLNKIKDPPKQLYGVGNVDALQPGIAIVGARKATPYGKSLAFKFGKLAAKSGVTVISGGAFGCDSEAHKGALAVGGKTVVFLGGGCNKVYPARNAKLFQQIIDSGGAVVSEKPRDYDAIKFTFVQRNRLIAGLSLATLVVEAGLPSGTFSTAKFALDNGRDVWSVPGSVTFPGSAGCNKLIYDGAVPIINEEVFLDQLMSLFKCNLVQSNSAIPYKTEHKVEVNPILQATLAHPMPMEDLFELASSVAGPENATSYLTQKLMEAESTGLITKYKNGMYGPIVGGKLCN